MDVRRRQGALLVHRLCSPDSTGGIPADEPYGQRGRPYHCRRSVVLEVVKPD